MQHSATTSRVCLALGLLLFNSVYVAEAGQQAWSSKLSEPGWRKAYCFDLPGAKAAKKTLYEDAACTTELTTTKHATTPKYSYYAGASAVGVVIGSACQQMGAYYYESVVVAGPISMAGHSGFDDEASCVAKPALSFGSSGIFSTDVNKNGDCVPFQLRPTVSSQEAQSWSQFTV